MPPLRDNTGVTLSAKQEMIQAFFEDFEDNVNRLRELRSKGYDIEAFTLCVVYIDRLASGHFGGTAGRNRRNFWRALTELGGSPLFGMLHPGHLRELAQRYCTQASELVDEITNRRPDALLDEKKVAEEIKQSSLAQDDKAKLIAQLWRASMANVVYDRIRVAEVHGPGSGGISFSRTIYEGKTDFVLDFDKLFPALREILKRVIESSISSGHWFGNPNYLKERG